MTRLQYLTYVCRSKSQAPLKTWTQLTRASSSPILRLSMVLIGRRVSSGRTIASADHNLGHTSRATNWARVWSKAQPDYTLKMQNHPMIRKCLTNQQLKRKEVLIKTSKIKRNKWQISSLLQSIKRAVLQRQLLPQHATRILKVKYPLRTNRWSKS